MGKVHGFVKRLLEIGSDLNESIDIVVLEPLLHLLLLVAPRAVTVGQVRGAAPESAS